MEISLPDEHGRHQILNIHTTRMKEFKKIADDVNMKVSQRSKYYYISNIHIITLHKCLGTCNKN